MEHSKLSVNSQLLLSAWTSRGCARGVRLMFIHPQALAASKPLAEGTTPFRILPPCRSLPLLLSHKVGGSNPILVPQSGACIRGTTADSHPEFVYLNYRLYSEN